MLVLSRACSVLLLIVLDCCLFAWLVGLLFDCLFARSSVNLIVGWIVCFFDEMDVVSLFVVCVRVCSLCFIALLVLFFFVRVGLFVCLFGWLIVCSFVHLFVRVFVGSFVCLLACLLACLLVCLFVCLFVCLPLCSLDCLFVGWLVSLLCVCLLFVCLFGQRTRDLLLNLPESRKPGTQPLVAFYSLFHAFPSVPTGDQRKESSTPSLGMRSRSGTPRVSGDLRLLSLWISPNVERFGGTRKQARNQRSTTPERRQLTIGVLLDK